VIRSFILSVVSSIRLVDILKNSDLVRIKISLENSVFLFIMLLIVVSFFVLLWGRYYILGDENLRLFFWILVGFVLSMVALIVSDRFLLLFIGWEGLGVSSFLLVIFYQNWNSLNGGILTLLTNRLGDAFIILALRLWLCSSSFGLIGGAMLIVLLLLIFSFTKSAQWPFIRWLPAAIAAPTPVRALVHSSTLVTAGVWLLFRFLENSPLSRAIALTLGRVTLLSARLAALLERDAKKIVALSTLRQLGLIVIVLFLGNKRGIFFHLLTHALAKANLFIVVGAILHETASQQRTRVLSITSYGILSLRIAVSIVRLSGLGFFSGIISKE